MRVTVNDTNTKQTCVHYLQIPRKKIINDDAQSQYPKTECIRELQPESFLSSNFETVRYGDYEFTQCKEGYIQVYMQAELRQGRYKTSDICSYGVYYGNMHPLYVQQKYFDSQ